MYVENADGGGKRYVSRFATRVMAIRMLNGTSMDDTAHQFVYGRSVPRDVRRPMMWLTAVEAKYQEHPTATKLNTLVQKANDCKIPAARNDIKLAVDYGLLSEEKDGREVFYFCDPDQFAKANLLLEIRDIIPAVVRKQAADPYNPIAGSELLKDYPGVYWNIINVAQFPDDRKE